MAIIETKNLTYTYPGAAKPSIADVSIKVEKGEFVLITGPSGCGKTTLCRCFNGLVPHFYQGELKGEITVAGENVLERHTYEMAKHVGLVFQNPENQLFALSVEKDVAFGLENLGVPREEIRQESRLGAEPDRHLRLARAFSPRNQRGAAAAGCDCRGFGDGARNYRAG